MVDGVVGVVDVVCDVMCDYDVVCDGGCDCV